MSRPLLVLWFGVLIIFAVFSFGLTDPNLVFSSWQPYWQFQNWAWDTFFTQKEVLIFTYFSLVLLLFIGHSAILTTLKKSSISGRNFGVFLLITALIMSLSYNALSHDLFNYIFNARMVVLYGENPHSTTATAFPDDLWVRFMHNTHTPAPYGYGWTGLSSLFYLFGGNIFSITWIIFKVLALASYLSLFWVYAAFLKKQPREAFFAKMALVLFNPLILIEVLSSGHNDLWMMTPAVLSMLLLLKKNSAKTLALSAVLLIFSISIKVVSVVLIPLWVVLVVRQYVDLVARYTQAVVKYLPELASLLFFLPLLTDRSQYFHPWYLIWSLVWLPFCRWKPWKVFLISLSITSLVRYIPALYEGGFTPEVVISQRLITWVPAVLATIVGAYSIYRKQGSYNE